MSRGARTRPSTLVGAWVGNGLVTNLGDYESIATTVVGAGGTGTITFSSIPSGYKHLQVRGLGIFSGAGSYGYIAFNGDNASGNYSSHTLYGTGSSAASNSATTQNRGTFTNAAGTSPDAPNAMVLDILDYANVNKYKTIRTLYAWDANGTGYVEFGSSNWRSTSAITSIVLSTSGNTFAQYSSFALYGIK